MAKQPITQPAPRDHEWAQAVDGADIRTPADGLKDAGYDGLDIPDHRDFNGLFRDWDQAMRCWLQRGVPVWHASEAYDAGDMVRYNGYHYVAVAPVLGSHPLTNFETATRQWIRVNYSNIGGIATDTDDVPIIQYRNGIGNPSNSIDRMGYVGGDYVQQWLETWKGSDGQVTTGAKTLSDTVEQWVCNVVRTTSGGINQNISGFGGRVRSMFVGVGTGASDVAEVQSNQATIFSSTNQFALTFRVLLGADVSEQRIALGLLDATTGDLYGDTNAMKGALLCKGNGDTNWQFITGSGAARTTTDTGIAASANGDFAIRIEWCGSSLSSDAASQARLYINGVRKARHTTNLPAGGTLCSVGFAAKRDTGSSARNLYIGPTRLSLYY